MAGRTHSQRRSEPRIAQTIPESQTKQSLRQSLLLIRPKSPRRQLLASRRVERGSVDDVPRMRLRTARRLTGPRHPYLTPATPPGKRLRPPPLLVGGRERSGELSLRPLCLYPHRNLNTSKPQRSRPRVQRLAARPVARAAPQRWRMKRPLLSAAWMQQLQQLTATPPMLLLPRSLPREATARVLRRRPQPSPNAARTAGSAAARRPRKRLRRLRPRPERRRLLRRRRMRRGR